jgi:hypothetical protein
MNALKPRYKLQTKVVYRLHLKAEAGHTTYTDYKHRSSAVRSMKIRDWNGWTPTHIERVIERYFTE